MAHSLVKDLADVSSQFVHLTDHSRSVADPMQDTLWCIGSSLGRSEIGRTMGPVDAPELSRKASAGLLGENSCQVL